VSHATQPRQGRRARRPLSRLAAVVGLAGLALLSAAADAGAQSPDRPKIVVAETIAAERAKEVPLPIRIAPESSMPRNSFVRVRGLPPMAALSEGHSIAPGAWAIPLQGLASLKITLPPNAAGRTDFVVTLVALDGTVLDEARSALVIGGRPPAAAQGERSVPTAPARVLGATAQPPGAVEERPARAAPSLKAEPPAMLPQDRERALKLLKQGDEQMAQGNVAAARPLYELAADAGLAQGAMALAGTYDPAELARFGVRGVQPNTAEARRWYERARQLGASDADQRLLRLGAK